MKNRTIVKLTTFSLPDDIIAEILLTLPVKTLLRFKCVCKPWRSLISSKYFIKAQLEHARNTPLSEQRTIVTSYEYRSSEHVFRHFPVSYLFSQQQTDDVPRCHFDYPMTNFGTCLVGCCNGLCCINIDGKYFILWNPATGMSHKLPPVLEKYDYIATQGFGYDESNDDYKVLVVYQRDFEETYRLYSLKSNSWKPVDDFMVDSMKVNSWKTVDDFQPYIHEKRAVTMNGKLHWATEINRSFFTIVTFDLVTETAGLIEQHCSGRVNYRYSSSLGVIQGCLCVVCEESFEGPTQVWIMKGIWSERILV